VLALITALKQICNHPAQFLREHDASTERSGKLRRLGEELETALAEGDAALLFTQYRAMGEILVRFVEERFALTAPFLHGGVSRSQRETMVARFQQEDGPPVMIVSVKAGGTGINLTRASHVVHVDRWWNPAVEAQATDRAHRIGQTRTVVVHTLVTAGTLEERIDKMLEEKAELAQLAVAGGEQWLTELDDAGLRELLALDPKTAGGSSDEEEQEVAP
jgi:SNF2 family DNA or RNA helicase